MTTPDAILFSILGGAALALALAAPFAWRRLRLAEIDVRAAEADADRARALLAASPDASFMFEAATGNEFCSRRLARLFDLAEDGRGVRFVDVLGRLQAADAEALMRAVARLRGRVVGYCQDNRQGRPANRRGLTSERPGAAGRSPTAELPLSERWPVRRWQVRLQ